MALSILNNIPSLEAQNQLATTNTNLQNTLFQLSSGSKINSGADDPAGLSIADGLQANISALTQSAQNVTDGVGMLQTADGALSQVTTLLNRAVTLATEAGNAGLTTAISKTALQNEFASITNEINQIGANTTYNNTQVFTSAPVTVFLSDGSNIDATNNLTTNSLDIAVSMSPLSASSLGLGTYATGTLDLQNAPSAGNTVQIGSQTYTFAATAGAANTVAYGTSAAQALKNLMEAVNNGPNGTGAGSDYGTGTLANTSATITSINGGSATIQALNAGTDGNSIQLTTLLTTAAGSSSADLNNGKVAVNALGTLQLGSAQPNVLTNATGALTLNGQPSDGVASGTFTLTGDPTPNDTVTIGNQAYTFVASGHASVAGDIAIDAGNELGTLTNLMNAVNTPGAGSNTTFDTTGITPNVTLATPTGGAGAASVVINATTSGSGGNVALTEDITGGLGNVTGSGTLTGGATPDTLQVGSTTYTFVAAGQATAGTEIALGSDLTHTIANIVGAINTGGAGAGGTYYTNAGTAAANGSATVAVDGANADKLDFTAVANGTDGNGGVDLVAGFTGLGATGAVSGVDSSHQLQGGLNADTVTIAGGTSSAQTYTFVAAGHATQAGDVALGNSVSATLTNLADAVNNSGGVAYNGTSNAGTATYDPLGANALIGMTASGNTATLTALGTVAASKGLAGNALTFASTIDGGNAVVGGTAGSATLAHGADAVGASGQLTFSSNPNAGDTVNIAGTSYTFVASGNATAANEVAITTSNVGAGAAAANLAATLNNLEEAVNTTGSGDANAGATSFGVGTGQNTLAQISNVAAGVVTVTAVLDQPAPGDVGNGLALSANLSGGAGGAVGSGVLAGGTAAADLNSAGDAQKALNSITSAIATVASQRGTIGSKINQLNAALQVMNNTSQNLTSSLSGIQDADIGQVVANMSKYQVLEQTGISALAQSNQREQAVLKLLQ